MAKVDHQEDQPVIQVEEEVDNNLNNLETKEEDQVDHQDQQATHPTILTIQMMMSIWMNGASTVERKNIEPMTALIGRHVGQMVCVSPHVDGQPEKVAFGTTPTMYQIWKGNPME